MSKYPTLHCPKCAFSYPNLGYTLSFVKEVPVTSKSTAEEVEYICSNCDCMHIAQIYVESGDRILTNVLAKDEDTGADFCERVLLYF